MASNVSRVDAWFVAEVLPLEPVLIRFLRRIWRNESDIRDLCQDVYVEIYQAAAKEIPASASALSFAIARNLVVERIRREQIVSIEAVADLDVLGIAVDEPGPDRTVMARQDLHRLQAALDRLPQDWRAAVLMRKLEGLSPREIALRLGIGERTAFRYLSSGLAMLADLFHDDTITGTKP
jgi:RNA polymerase sigma-70 factor (ECF subfamily)